MTDARRFGGGPLGTAIGIEYIYVEPKLQHKINGTGIKDTVITIFRHNHCDCTAEGSKTNCICCN